MIMRTGPRRPSRATAPPTLLPIALAALLLPAPACSTFPTREPGSTAGNPLIPTRHQAKVGAFRVASNTPMADDDPALIALAGLEARLERILGVRVPEQGPPIDVYILDDEQAFTTFLMFHHPELPSRRAFFLAVGDASAVYTARGEHLEEDLRHEATHALLHRAIGHVPLWLDEGLAEYFEVEPRAVPAEAIDRFRRLAGAYRGGWRPDLTRLEALDDVAGMTPTDYREAWAWTLLLLHGPRRAALVAHLDRLRSEGEDAPALSEALRGDLPQLNRQFLAQVGAEAPSLTRLQSPPSTPAPAPAPRVVTAPAIPPRTVVLGGPGGGVPLPAEPPRGPIGRLREGIGQFLGRLIP